MRLDINLASQPYEDSRQFWLRWGTAVGVMAILTLTLLTLTVTGWMNASKDRAAMSEKRTLIAKCDQKRAEAESILNLPQNRVTRDTSQFLNGLIERKAFSWTQVLENMEKVMPPRVHLVAISPGLDEDNQQLILKMTVAGDSRDRAIELARHMEDSRRFSQTTITGERFLERNSNSSDTEQFDVTAVYVPEVAPLAESNASAEKTGAKSGATETKNTTNKDTKTAAPMTGVSRPPAPKTKSTSSKGTQPH